MLNYIKGMDISSLDEIEKLGAKFYDNGEEKRSAYDFKKLWHKLY